MRAILATVAASVLCALAAGANARANAAELQSIVLPRGSVIVAEGDSLTYGYDDTPGITNPPINGSHFTRSNKPYPEALGTMLKPNCGDVVNRGFPGDRSVDGLVRWQGTKAGALTLLMLGSNDALNYGRAATGIVSVSTYSSVISLMVEKLRREGSLVVILLPPPIQNPRADAMIAPYREEARKVAIRYDLPVVDVPLVLNGATPIWNRDQVHLSENSNTLLAEYLAKRIRCE